MTEMPNGLGFLIVEILGKCWIKGFKKMLETDLIYN